MSGFLDLKRWALFGLVPDKLDIFRRCIQYTFERVDGAALIHLGHWVNEYVRSLQGKDLVTGSAKAFDILSICRHLNRRLVLLALLGFDTFPDARNPSGLPIPRLRGARWIRTPTAYPLPCSKAFYSEPALFPCHAPASYAAVQRALGACVSVGWEAYTSRVRARLAPMCSQRRDQPSVSRAKPGVQSNKLCHRGKGNNLRGFRV